MGPGNRNNGEMPACLAAWRFVKISAGQMIMQRCCVSRTMQTMWTVLEIESWELWTRFFRSFSFFRGYRRNDVDWYWCGNGRKTAGLKSEGTRRRRIKREMCAWRVCLFSVLSPRSKPYQPFDLLWTVIYCALWWTISVNVFLSLMVVSLRQCATATVFVWRVKVDETRRAGDALWMECFGVRKEWLKPERDGRIRDFCIENTTHRDISFFFFFPPPRSFIQEFSCLLLHYYNASISIVITLWCPERFIAIIFNISPAYHIFLSAGTVKDLFSLWQWRQNKRPIRPALGSGEEEIVSSADTRQWGKETWCWLVSSIWRLTFYGRTLCVSYCPRIQLQSWLDLGLRRIVWHIITRIHTGPVFNGSRRGDKPHLEKSLSS